MAGTTGSVRGRLTLLNDEDLLFKLQALPKKIRNKALRKGMRSGAKIIQKEAKKLAPVDTGALRRNIKVRAGKRSRKGPSVEVVIQKKAGGEDAFYGAFQELGTNRHEAQPFLRPAFENKQHEAATMTRREIINVIDEVSRM